MLPDLCSAVSDPLLSRAIILKLLYSGGGETTAITIHMFFLMMCMYPDIQKNAQAEMDQIVGRGRLPTFEDREKLPYLEALTKEVMRYHPAVPDGEVPFY
jgi:cytochrome P450